MKTLVLCTALVAPFLMGTMVFGDLLMAVDFSGSGGVVSIASDDGQVSTHPNLTYKAGLAMAAIGGSSGTSGWVMDGTGEAAVNNDLHTASTFGAPSRMDLYLGFADIGFSYSITNVEIVVRAAASSQKNWDFMYRDSEGADHILSGTAIAVQAGADARTTYSIDLTGQGLAGTADTVSWDATKDLRIGFWEANGVNADNLQIDAVRLNGTVIPEPATLTLIALMGGGVLFVHRFFR